MRWEPFSLHFKQIYRGGYKFLDKCGEFVLEAERTLKTMSTETLVTGAKMEIPEDGIQISVNTIELVVFQEMIDDGGERFFNVCESVSKLAVDMFEPVAVERNGFASKKYQRCTKSEEGSEMSLGFDDSSLHDELSKAIGMVPLQRSLDLQFKSGNTLLRCRLHPLTFEKIAVQRHNAGAGATEEQKARANRFNKKADRMDRGFTHALMLEVDLMETNPPQSSLRHQFEDLLKKETAIIKGLKK